MHKSNDMGLRPTGGAQLLVTNAMSYWQLLPLSKGEDNSELKTSKLKFNNNLVTVKVVQNFLACRVKIWPQFWASSTPSWGFVPILSKLIPVFAGSLSNAKVLVKPRQSDFPVACYL